MNTSDAIAVIGVVVGVLAVIAGVVYAKAHGKPVYRQTGNRVVAASPGDRITVQYDGQDVPYVTRSRIAFWNAGSKTLNGSEIAKNHPIQFVFPGEEIKVLSIEKLRFSDEANLFQAEKDDSGSRVQISFDYLEPRQGAVIEVTHTSAEWNAKALGKIKGVPRGIRQSPSPNSGRFLAIALASFYLGVILLTAIGGLIWVIGGAIWIKMALGVIVIFLIGWGGIVGWRNIREPRKLSLNK
jgi:hypothetical protein